MYRWQWHLKGLYAVICPKYIITKLFFEFLIYQYGVVVLKDICNFLFFLILYEKFSFLATFIIFLFIYYHFVISEVALMQEVFSRIVLSTLAEDKALGIDLKFSKFLNKFSSPWNFNTILFIIFLLQTTWSFKDLQGLVVLHVGGVDAEENVIMVGNVQELQMVKLAHVIRYIVQRSMTLFVEMMNIHIQMNVSWDISAV